MNPIQNSTVAAIKAGEILTRIANQKTKMKTAIIILSDPKAGDEALGRVFNALAVADECLKSGDEVEIVFNGAGTRWPEELTKVSHPANGLYNAVREAVKGASCGCAVVFGASKGVEACGIPTLKDKALAGTPGISNLRRYLAEGWQTLIF
jgi:predicted peroxiredoxin